MSGSLNKVTLIGNLGIDPEVRRLNNGNPVVNFRMATSESWKDKATGEKKERVEWHSIVIFNEGLCKVAEQWLGKGSKVYVEGELQTRKWQDKDGNDRYSTEIVLTGFDAKLIMLGDGNGGTRSDPNGNSDRPGNKVGGGYAEQSGGTAADRKQNDFGYGGGSAQRDLDDEIPF